MRTLRHHRALNDYARRNEGLPQWYETDPEFIVERSTSRLIRWLVASAIVTAVVWGSIS